MNYYLNKHIPLVKKLFADACLRIEVEEAIIAANTKDTQPFYASAHFTFLSLVQFNEIFDSHGPEILQDIESYTNVEPVIQIGSVCIR